MSHNFTKKERDRAPKFMWSDANLPKETMTRFIYLFKHNNANRNFDQGTSIEGRV